MLFHFDADYDDYVENVVDDDENGAYQLATENGESLQWQRNRKHWNANKMMN